MRFVGTFLLLSLFAQTLGVDIHTALYVSHLKKSSETSNVAHVAGKLYSVYSAASAGDNCDAQLDFLNAVNPIAIPFDPTAVSTKPSFAPAAVTGPAYCVSTIDFAEDFYSRVDFKNFPFDYQRFEVILGSRDSTSNFILRPRVAGLSASDFSIPGWRDISSSVSTYEVTNPVTGYDESRVVFEKTVRREFTYFLSKYISNVILLVIMSIFTALLPVNSNMRILLVLLVFIAIILWQKAIVHKLPSAAYPNTYDAFIHISFSVVFTQFLYYVVHKFFRNRTKASDNLDVDAIKPVGETSDAIHEDASIYISSSTGGIPAQDGFVVATLKNLDTSRKVDIAVTFALSIYYFIACASVLGLGTDLWA